MFLWKQLFSRSAKAVQWNPVFGYSRVSPSVYFRVTTFQYATYAYFGLPGLFLEYCIQNPSNLNVVFEPRTERRWFTVWAHIESFSSRGVDLAFSGMAGSQFGWRSSKGQNGRRWGQRKLGRRKNGEEVGDQSTQGIAGQVGLWLGMRENQE